MKKLIKKVQKVLALTPRDRAKRRNKTKVLGDSLPRGIKSTFHEGVRKVVSTLKSKEDE